MTHLSFNCLNGADYLKAKLVLDKTNVRLFWPYILRRTSCNLWDIRWMKHLIGGLGLKCCPHWNEWTRDTWHTAMLCTMRPLDPTIFYYPNILSPHNEWDDARGVIWWSVHLRKWIQWLWIIPLTLSSCNQTMVRGANLELSTLIKIKSMASNQIGIF